VVEILSEAGNSLFPVVTGTILEPTQFPTQRSPQAGIKQPGSAAEYYPQSSSEIKNTFTLPYIVMCVIKYRVSFDGIVC
jgi:hypothetical protein